MHLKYEDWEKFQGKKLKVVKGAAEITGVLKGLDDSGVGVAKDKVVRPWLVETETGEIALHPEDGWRICTGV
jgi:hypothetical protein